MPDRTSYDDSMLYASRNLKILDPELKQGAVETYTTRTNAGEIKKAKGPRAIEMVKLREGMFQAINDCAGMLEATAHKTSLKGGCEYL